MGACCSTARHIACLLGDAAPAPLAAVKKARCAGTDISMARTPPRRAQGPLSHVELGAGARPLRVARPDRKVVQHDRGGHRHVQAGGAGAVLRDVHQRVARRQLRGRQPRALRGRGARHTLLHAAGRRRAAALWGLRCQAARGRLCISPEP
jgi:hypothetical protein